MRSIATIVTFCLLGGCSSTWTAVDDDHDGYSLAAGDCDDSLAGAEVHPGADDSWYDGIDQDCAGNNDYDQDGDGHASIDYPDPTGVLPSDDCWDEPGFPPADVVTMDTDLDAADVNPAAAETWYDGVDQDCGGEDDFDQDGDGYGSAYQTGPEGVGADCMDADTDPWTNEAALSPSVINPGADETWYDGTDADCAGDDDFDQDKDGWRRDDECDDTDPARYPDPSIPEVWYDGVDDNCDGNDGDQDGDGYYAADYAFEVPSGYEAGDCWDDPSDPGWIAITPFEDPAPEAVHPDATEVWYDGLDEDCAADDDFDQDADGYRTDSYIDGTGTIAGDDCVDTDATAFPGASDSWYDGIDSDCAGNEDYDQDGDGHLDASGGGDDCDDVEADVHPGASEACDSLDADCDGSTNDPNSGGCTDFYNDGDGDGYGSDSDSLCLCEAEGTYVADAPGDCDDTDSAISPSAVETCATAADDDCDGDTVGVDAVACDDWFADTDFDGHGGSLSQCACEADGLYTASADDDCDDGDETAFPGGTEVCDAVDNDCDGSVDEGVGGWYPDADEDGDGDATGTPGCEAAGLVENSDDCDDTLATVYTGADELCDGVANDCATATSWTSADEDGLVASVDASGVWTDITGDVTGSTTVTFDLETGYTYYFCAGSYDTKIRGIGDTAEVVGVYGSDVTFLDISASVGSVLSVNTGDVTVTGFTITGGHGSGSTTTYGGGVFATSSAALSAANLTMNDVVVTGNTAVNGGGVAAYFYAWVEMNDCSIEGNVTTGSGDGGGIYLDDGRIVGNDSYLVDNDAADDGGGMYIDTGIATWTGGGIYANLIGNSSHGGGVYLANTTTTVASFTATNVDFGTGADDNDLTDVVLKSGSSTYVSYTGYTSGETFTCLSSSDACSPTP